MMGNSVEWRHYSGRLLYNKRRAGISEVAHVLSGGNSFPLCVILFFFPHPFFPSRPRTSSHHPSHTCTHCTRYMFERTCAAAAPVSHFTFHPAALLYLSVFFFFFSRDIYRTIFRSPGQFPRRPLKINPALRPAEALRTYVRLAIRCEWN